MLKMIRGVKIKDANKLNEGFEVSDKLIISNVNSDKILKMLRAFIDIQDDQLFLIIEVPANIKNENLSNHKFHRDIYYTNKITKDAIREIFSSFGELFINDGLAQIGIGNYVTHAEIMTYKYNVVSVYAGDENIKKYENMFISNKFKKTDKLLTAWDYFTSTNPGESFSIKENGKTVYDVINILKETKGLYFSRRSEE